MSDVAGLGDAAGAAASIYVANRQYEIAKRAQDRQDIITARLEAREAKFDAMWDTYYEECEQKHISDICSRERCRPDYDASTNNALVTVRRAFGNARDQMYQCSQILCVGATTAQERALSIAEANASIDAVTRARRYEEERCEILNAKLDDLVYRSLQLGRGMIVQATNAAQITTQLLGETAGGAGALAAFSLDKAFRSFGRLAESVSTSGQQTGQQPQVSNQNTPTVRIEAVTNPSTNGAGLDFPSDVYPRVTGRTGSSTSQSTDGGISGEDFFEY